jgi:hypothetical protein
VEEEADAKYQSGADAMTTKMTKELIDRIFKEPGIKYELTEFEKLGKPIHEILSIYSKTVDSGRDAGKIKYYLKSFVPFPSGKEEVQVYMEGGKSAPEEIVRQLWVYRPIHLARSKPFSDLPDRGWAGKGRSSLPGRGRMDDAGCHGRAVSTHPAKHHYPSAGRLQRWRTGRIGNL